MRFSDFDINVNALDGPVPPVLFSIQNTAKRGRWIM